MKFGDRYTIQTDTNDSCGREVYRPAIDSCVEWQMVEQAWRAYGAYGAVP